MITVEDKIKKIIERWFLLDPLMFNIFCTHKLQKNPKLKVPIRSGKMMIEYSPVLLENLSDIKIEEYLKAEVFRIVLKHPYERVPQDANKVALAMASDVTIEQLSDFTIPLHNYAELGLKRWLSYEEYYRELKFRPIAQLDYGKTDDADEDKIDSNQQKSSEKQESSENLNRYGYQKSFGKQKNFIDKYYSDQQKAAECAALWQEDDLAVEEINAQILKAQKSSEWGSLSGDMKQLIEASLVVKIDYRKILSSFRASILSQKRELTRTRPNRRYGFDFMGSRYKFTTKLLIAVDVSGSISDEKLVHFFSIINRFFKYGIKSIDVIQFDYKITAPLVNLKKAKKLVAITGRGGTSFQPPLDYYAAEKEYVGLIVFTDGDAEIPKVSTYRRILWVLTNEHTYNNAISWIKTLPNNKAMYIP